MFEYGMARARQGVMGNGNREARPEDQENKRHEARGLAALRCVASRVCSNVGGTVAHEDETRGAIGIC